MYDAEKSMYYMENPKHYIGMSMYYVETPAYDAGFSTYQSDFSARPTENAAKGLPAEKMPYGMSDEVFSYKIWPFTQFFLPLHHKKNG